MIKKISFDEAFKFFWSQKPADRRQLDIRDHGTFYGYFIGEDLKSIICVVKFTKKKRITCFLTVSDERGKGYGDKLLKKVLDMHKGNITAFATEHSRSLFLKNGFKEMYTNKFNVTFMEVNNEI